MRRAPRRARRAAAAAAIGVAALAPAAPASSPPAPSSPSAPSASSPASSSPSAPSASSPASPSPSAPSASSPRAPTLREAWIADVVAPAVARRRPGAGRVVARIGTRAPWNGGPVGLLVLDARDRWLKVLLPRRPNGSTGWIARDRTETRPTPWRIRVSLPARRVRLLRRGRVVASAGAVIGLPATPTPRGRFAVAERVRQPDPHGFLGPWALHLTAHSDVLDDFGGGPGRVAIHGRDGASLRDPLGSAASHGCIRVPDAFVRRLARDAREGTPVDVR